MKKYTHIQIQNFSTSQFPTQTISFCCLTFLHYYFHSVKTEKENLCSIFSQVILRTGENIWKALSLDVLSVNWTCKPQFTPLNFWVSFWEERVMKGYQFLTGRKHIIYMSNHFPIHYVILQNRKVLLNSAIILN